MKKVVILGVMLSLSLTTGLPAKDKAFLKKKTLELLDAYCPDGSIIVRNIIQCGPDAEGDLTVMIDGEDEHACVTSINTVVHEENHGINIFYSREVLKKKFGKFSDVFYDYDYYYLKGGKFVIFKKTPTFPSKEMVPTFPEHLRTFRFSTYIATDEAIQSTQNEGIYGLLDEMNSYYQGTRAAFDLLPYYEKKGASANWHDYFTGVNTTYYGCLEFRHYILKYLMYAKDRHPDLYKGILGNKAFAYTFLAVDKNVSDFMQSYFEKKKAVINILRGYGWKVSDEGGSFRITINGKTTGHGNFMEVYTLLDEEMKKPEYLQVLKTLKESAAGWDPESVYTAIALEMKNTGETDTEGGTVDIEAPRLENRSSLKELVDANDRRGDAKRSFIDMVGASVSKDNQGLLVKMRLAGLSDQLTFNQPKVGENAREYAWSAYFDLDGDGADDYILEFSNFKQPNAKSVRGGIVDNTQLSLWKIEADGMEMVDVRTRGAEEGNELIMDLSPCDFVSAINDQTQIHFKTSFYDGTNTYEDSLPD